MKKRLFFTLATIGLVATLVACGSNTKESSNNQGSESSSAAPSTSNEPQKKIEVTNITLSTQNEKAYVTVTGKQTNYTADEFKWAWGIADQSGEFADGSETPAADAFKKATFSATNTFSVKYCLTDITTTKSGTLYTIYGGTPESYQEIPFQSNNYSAQDASRRYYLRSDQSNALVYDCIQPISFTKASVVKVDAEDLPAGVTNAGAYLKFGGPNSKNYTMNTINGWNEAEKIAGNFQRVIAPDNPVYSIHEHVAEERFWKIEGNEIYFYCYIGFIEVSEGWMTHFDLVEGNANSNLQFDTTINGEQLYTAGDAAYRVYADKNNGGSEEHYWGCLGVYRENVA